jgi:hypothetical protein
MIAPHYEKDFILMILIGSFYSGFARVNLIPSSKQFPKNNAPKIKKTPA